MIPLFTEASFSYVFLFSVAAASMYGFYNRGFYYINVFQPSQVFAGKYLWTTVTSAMVHGGWMHLIANLVFCTMFMTEVEYMLVDDFGTGIGRGMMALLFIAIATACNLLDGFRHRNRMEVSAVGLSGFTFAMVMFFYVYFPLDESIRRPAIMAYHYAFALPVGCVVAWMIKLPFNHFVHLMGCFLGALTAALIRPELIDELWEHFKR